MDEFMNKLLRANGDLPALNASDPAFQKLYPTLWAFLTCSAVRDENDQVVPRRTSTISVYMGLGGPQAFLNDRACQRCLTVTAERFGDLWKALESVLCGNPIPWRMLDGWVPEKKSTKRGKGG